MKTQLFIIIQLLLLPSSFYACPACKKVQPILLQGISHGTGAESDWDYLIVSIASTIVFLCFYLALRFLVSPGELEDDHIKYKILNL